jgi:hypothetical protein
MTGTVPAVGGRRQVPAPDPVARDYILLALRLDQHVPGLVDGYYGPADLKARAETESLRAPAALAGDAAALRARLPGDVPEPDRRRWLDRQLAALEALASGAAGEERTYAETVRLCFDAAPERVPPAAYPEVRAQLDAILPGSGPVGPRLEAWDARFTIPGSRVPAVVDWLLPRIREASAAVFAAPEGEELQVGLVTGQPWAGYNWYDGGLRSRVDLNVDLPIRPYDLVATLSHETFPGHHLEHAWKEARLVHELRRVEASILLIDTPECYVSEGLAELGRRFTIDTGAWVELVSGACAQAQLPIEPADAERQVAVGAARHRLRGGRGDAALLLHGEGRARDQVRAFLVEEVLLSPDLADRALAFIEDPLWSTYVFSYAGGERLLARWCDAPGAPPHARFFRLLTEQLTPSGMAGELAG